MTIIREAETASRALNGICVAVGNLAMPNRFVSDIGDYLKLGILPALSPGYRLGIARWLHPDESTIGMDAILAIWSDQTSGGTMIQSCGPDRIHLPERCSDTGSGRPPSRKSILAS